MFRAHLDRIVVQPDEVKETTKSGLILAASVAEGATTRTGTVVSVGSGRPLSDGTLFKPDVQVGERVLYGKFAGAPFTVEDTAYVALRDEDILVVLAPKVD